MAALLGSGIKANKNLSADKKGWEVRIAESDFPRAMSILESRGLPSRESMTMGEIFKREGFATSATKQKALYVFGLEDSMRQKLLQIDGVVEAAVSNALPDRARTGRQTAHSSASVFAAAQYCAAVQENARGTDTQIGGQH